MGRRRRRCRWQQVAVVALVFRNGRVLSMRRSPDRGAGAGLWETISGRVEADEQPLCAAQREILEESGLETTLDPRPVDAYAIRRGDVPMTVVVYRAKWIAGEVQRSHEHDMHAWLKPEEFAQRSTLDRLAEAIERAATDGFA